LRMYLVQLRVLLNWNFGPRRQQQNEADKG